MLTILIKTLFLIFILLLCETRVIFTILCEIQNNGGFHMNFIQQGNECKKKCQNRRKYLNEHGTLLLALYKNSREIKTDVLAKSWNFIKTYVLASL